MRKTLLSLAVFAIAFAILSVSFFRKDLVIRAFPLSSTTPLILGVSAPIIDYPLVYPGKILPDNPLWPLKAIRDRILYVFESDPLKKSELALQFSDKRLAASIILFQNKKPDLASSTLTKGEKYLDLSYNDMLEAKNKGKDVLSFANKLMTASLKHRMVIESGMNLIPEDLKPMATKDEDYSKNIYKKCVEILNSKGIFVAKSPFDGQ